MPYVTETETPINGGRVRREAQIDLARFAEDFAKAIGGKPLPVDNDMDAKTRRTILIGRNILSLTVPHYVPAAKMKVTFSISAPDVKHDERNFYDKAAKTESATVSPDSRTIERIAADIKRRVIEANVAALAAQRDHAKSIREGRASIVRLAAALKARMPALDIRVNEADRRAVVYGSGETHYVNATLNADGSVNVERLGSMSLSKFERVMQVLNEK